MRAGASRARIAERMVVDRWMLDSGNGLKVETLDFTKALLMMPIWKRSSSLRHRLYL